MKISSSVAPHIYLEASESNLEFFRKTNSALAKIQSKRSGQSLLDGLRPYARSGKTVTIYASEVDATSALLTADQARARGIDCDNLVESNNIAVKLAKRRDESRANEGVRALVQWNPDAGLRIDERGAPYLEIPSEVAYIALAHELVHAKYIIEGNYFGYDGDPLDPDSDSFREEQRAVGIGEFSYTIPSENSIRAEHSQPIRSRYRSGTPEPK
ncbi:XopG/HopH/AvrPtoH family type III secretion system effector [Burkholderia ambifaria]|uniref:Effector protein n=1 Tax=Burkholderia ambifaria TaxID=152480 RepID=A0AA41E944_9BURK|nr:XopG/HopH/AvrPtoH family type III secretion system effector [Burkholderia ambifaria]MBR8130743.1 hypothetical protein [Burkholderia ambifaria]